MAIEYSLKLSDALAEPELEQALAAAGMTRSDDDATVWAGDGVTAVVGASVDRFGRYMTAFSFSPASDVLFTIDKAAAAYDAGMATMLHAVTLVLDTAPGDIVLMSNHDTALLLRRLGTVTLTTHDDWWTTTTPPFAEQITTPYRFEPLPVI